MSTFSPMIAPDKLYATGKVGSFRISTLMRDNSINSIGNYFQKFKYLNINPGFMKVLRRSFLPLQLDFL